MENGGRIPLEDLIGPVDDAAAIRSALAALDHDDLIQVRDGHVDIAYPFSATPTPFIVHLAGGRERYTCCALDALGIAPPIRDPVQLRSRCHHCAIPLEFAALPAGLEPDADGVMLWFGKRGDEWTRSERRSTSSGRKKI